MKDIFAGAGVRLQDFAIIFDEDGKPVGITGTYDGERVVEMGDVEMTMVVRATSFTLAKVHVDQKALARRLCCVNGVCKWNPS